MPFLEKELKRGLGRGRGNGALGQLNQVEKSAEYNPNSEKG